MKLGWLQQLQQEWIIPEIISERCVHSHCEVAECTRCVEACPRDAWCLTDESLHIAVEDCDGCGLCVAACTEQALEQTRVPALRYYESKPSVLVACEAALQTTNHEGIVPCLHSLNADTLFSYYRDGFQQLLSCRGDCENCPRYLGKDHFREQLNALNRLLHSRQAPRVRHAQLAPQDWHRVLTTKQDHPPRETAVNLHSRRTFLQQGIRFAAEQTLTQLDNKPTETTLEPWVEQLPASPTPEAALYPYVPQLHSTRCNACDACVQLCPHQALQKQPANEEQPLHYQIHAARCSGCELCVDVCDQQAIQLKHMSPQQQTTIPLQQHSCKACGSQFHYPISQNTQAYCRICARTNHHRQLFQVY